MIKIESNVVPKLKSDYKRLLSIDIMRAIAIVFMIGTHFTELLADERRDSAMGNFGELIWIIIDILGSIAAPFFLFLVGISLIISVSKKTCKS